MARKPRVRKRPTVRVAPRIDAVQSNKEAGTSGGLAALLEKPLPMGLLPSTPCKLTDTFPEELSIV